MSQRDARVTQNTTEDHLSSDVLIHLHLSAKTKGLCFEPTDASHPFLNAANLM